MKKENRKALARLVKVLISLAFIAFITSKLDFNQLREILLKSNYRLLILALGSSFLAEILASFAWYQILKQNEMIISMPASFKIRMVSRFIGVFFPSQLGVFSKAFFLNTLNKSNSISTGLATIFLERFTSSLIVGIMIISGYIYFLITNYFNYQIFGVMSIMFVTHVMIIGILLIMAFQSSNLITPISKVFRKMSFLSFLENLIKSSIDKFGNIANILRELLMSSRSLANYTFLIFLYYLTGFSLTAYFILLALDIHLPFLMIAFLSVTLTSIRVLPISFNGIGFTEGVGIVLFLELGLNNTEALAFMLIYQIFSSYIFSVVGSIFVPDFGVNTIKNFKSSYMLRRSH